MAEQKATNVTWHDGDITIDDRSVLLDKKALPSGLQGFQVAVKVLSLWRWKKHCFSAAS